MTNRDWLRDDSPAPSTPPTSTTKDLSFLERCSSEDLEIRNNTGVEDPTEVPDHFVDRCKELWDMRLCIERESNEEGLLETSSELFLLDLSLVQTSLTEEALDEGLETDDGFCCGDSGSRDNNRDTFRIFCNDSNHPEGYSNEVYPKDASINIVKDTRICTNISELSTPNGKSGLDIVTRISRHACDKGRSSELYNSIPYASRTHHRKDSSHRNCSRDRESFESTDAVSSESSMDNRYVRDFRDMSSSVDMSLTESYSSSYSNSLSVSKRDSGYAPQTMEKFTDNAIPGLSIDSLSRSELNNQVIKHQDTLETPTPLNIQGFECHKRTPPTKSLKQTTTPKVNNITKRRSTTDRSQAEQTIEDGMDERDYSIDETTFRIFKKFVKVDPTTGSDRSRRKGWRLRNQKTAKHLSYPSDAASNAIAGHNPLYPSAAPTPSDLTMIVSTTVDIATSLGATSSVPDKNRLLRCFKVMNQARDSIEEETEEDLSGGGGGVNE